MASRHPGGFSSPCGFCRIRGLGAQVSTLLGGQRGLSLDTPSTQVNADHHLNFTLATGGCPVECRTTWDLPSHSLPPIQGADPHEMSYWHQRKITSLLEYADIWPRICQSHFLFPGLRQRKITFSNRVIQAHRGMRYWRDSFSFSGYTKLLKIGFLF